eukprot:3262979-Lingulodinium_polyedra.AAC.1
MRKGVKCFQVAVYKQLIHEVTLEVAFQAIRARLVTFGVRGSLEEVGGVVADFYLAATRYLSTAVVAVVLKVMRVAVNCEA